MRFAVEQEHYDREKQIIVPSIWGEPVALVAASTVRQAVDELNKRTYDDTGAPFRRKLHDYYESDDSMAERLFPELRPFDPK